MRISFFRIAGVVVLLLVALVMLMSAANKVRQISESSAESRRRGLFIKAPVLPQSIAPTADGFVEIEEAWVERSMRLRLRWWVWPTRVPTANAALVLRVNPPNARATVGVLGAAGLADTIWLGPWIYASEYLIVAERRSPLPDTLHFVTPRRRRR
jgi:hypothetical protein